ncbi:hypothetical protein WMF11_40820 [Sorangium sp. So ce295]|jgi:hypothetical protein|uniref:hypothetical protein n=1 Tax=Sorangium sp. So ce295 TaxID=3133295 RepID=UPI003F5E9EE2
MMNVTSDALQLNTQRNLRAALQHAIRSMTRPENPPRNGAATPGAGAETPGLLARG